MTRSSRSGRRRRVDRIVSNAACRFAACSSPTAGSIPALRQTTSRRRDASGCESVTWVPGSSIAFRHIAAADAAAPTSSAEPRASESCLSVPTLVGAGSERMLLITPPPRYACRWSSGRHTHTSRTPLHRHDPRTPLPRLTDGPPGAVEVIQATENDVDGHVRSLERGARLAQPPRRKPSNKFVTERRSLTGSRTRRVNPQVLRCVQTSRSAPDAITPELAATRAGEGAVRRRDPCPRCRSCSHRRADRAQTSEHTAVGKIRPHPCGADASW